MRQAIAVVVWTVGLWGAAATPTLAGSCAGPAPLLAAGPVGLAVLGVAGAGYLGLRYWRRRR